MKNINRIDQDWHVSSTFSDGSGTVAEIVQAAEALGLEVLCIVDRARRSSPWVRDLAGACRIADRGSSLEVRSGLEIEILDTNGAFDLPPFASKVDRLFLAAYRLPTPSGPLEIEEARARIERGELLPAQAVEWLVRAYATAVGRRDGVVLAHPFSVLPRIGVDPRKVHPSYVRWLAGVMQDTGAVAESNEFLQAPSAQVADCLMTAGVPVLPASGARSPQALGGQKWYRETLGSVSSLARAA